MDSPGPSDASSSVTPSSCSSSSMDTCTANDQRRNNYSVITVYFQIPVLLQCNKLKININPDLLHKHITFLVAMCFLKHECGGQAIFLNILTECFIVSSWLLNLARGLKPCPAIIWDELTVANATRPSSSLRPKNVEAWKPPTRRELAERASIYKLQQRGFNEVLDVPSRVTLVFTK